MKHDLAKTWMQRYFNAKGDKMPMTNQIHVPAWDSQKEIHRRYKEDMTQQMLDRRDIICQSMFYNLWMKEFPHIVIPEVCLNFTCLLEKCCFSCLVLMPCNV